MMVGEHIRKLRLDRKMSLADLAEASRLSKGFISQLESGKSNASLASLHRLAQALDVPLSVLVSSEHGAPEPGAETLAQAPTFDSNYSLDDLIPLAALSGSQAGTHFVATIPRNSSLKAGRGRSGANVGTAIAVVLHGNARMRQGSTFVNGSVGSVMSWAADDEYWLENTGSGAAKVLLFLPVGSAMPKVVATHHVDVRTSTRERYSSTSDGPMRLAEMRARRLAGQRR
jgi:transcriptional regulator with XRE-family HTH domain